MKEITSRLNPLESLPDSKSAEKKPQSSVPPDISFQKILSEARSEAVTSSGLESGSNSLSEINAPSPFSFASEPDFSYPSRIEETLDQLEKYSRLLGDPDITLREIAPVLALLDEQTRSLVNDLNGDEKADNTLVDIVSQIMTTVHIQQFKMERGDFTDQ